jgi:hypothetical protein
MSDIHRRYTLKIKIGADDWKEMRHALHSIEHDLYDREDGDIQITSGGVGSGWTITGTCDPQMTHEKYFEAIEATREQRKAVAE